MAHKVIADLGGRHSANVLSRQVLGCRSARFLAGDSSLQVRTHLIPRDGLSIRDNPNVSLFGCSVKIGIPFFFRLLRDRGQDEAVGGGAGTLGRGDDPGLQIIG